MLQYHFNWKTLSAIAGITWWNFYFRLFPGAIKGPQIIEFLEHLQRHLPGKLLVIWDGLPGHRSRLVKDFVTGQAGRLELEWLPSSPQRRGVLITRLNSPRRGASPCGAIGAVVNTA